MVTLSVNSAPLLYKLNGPYNSYYLPTITYIANEHILLTSGYLTKMG